MVKKFILLLVLLVLAACSTIPPGDYYLMPAGGPITPDYTYCEGANCYRVQLLDEVFQPTQEVFPTEEEPAPTYTPLPLPSCLLTATVNVNVRQVPGGTVLGVIVSGDTTGADARYTYNGVLYYRVWWPPKGTYAWTADYYTEKGNCAALPVVNPF